jgi:hypothetical protein
VAKLTVLYVKFALLHTCDFMVTSGLETLHAAGR